jgi:hypothetical protein
MISIYLSREREREREKERNNPDHVDHAEKFKSLKHYFSTLLKKLLNFQFLRSSTDSFGSVFHQILTIQSSFKDLSPSYFDFYKKSSINKRLIRMTSQNCIIPTGDSPSSN